MSEAGYWTVAYRKPTANHFKRIPDVGLSWDDALELAERVADAMPGYQVWYVTNAQAEADGYVCEEDRGNVLMDSGKRVRVRDTGKLPEGVTVTVTLPRVPTNELRRGDVVLEHGMRVRLYADPKVYDGRPYSSEAYSWPGFVENYDEVLAEGFVPRSFLCEDRWDDSKGWVIDLTCRWTIQGNYMATWCVERTY